MTTSWSIETLVIFIFALLGLLPKKIKMGTLLVKYRRMMDAMSLTYNKIIVGF